MTADADQSPALTRALHDLVEHGNRVASLVSRGRTAYDSDEMLRFAAESLLIRAGEAVARVDRVSPGFSQRHPEFELRNLKDSRNLVAHGYDIVDPDLIWVIMETHIPRVVMKVERYLRGAE